MFPFFAGLAGFIAWIYGLPIFIIGLLIILNSKEDKIEERRDVIADKKKSERRLKKNGR